MSAEQSRNLVLTLIYPRMNWYFGGFSKKEIPLPPTLDVNCDEQPTLAQVLQEIEKHLNEKTPVTHFVADTSILDATNLILKNPGRLVVVGGAFRLTEDVADNALYIPIKNRNPSRLWCEDARSFPTVMAVAYTRLRLQMRKIDIDPFGYFQLRVHVKHMLEEKEVEKIQPFVLATMEKKAFDQYLKDTNSESQFEIVSLYPEFMSLLRTRYKEFEIKEDILADVLIARREDVESSKTLLQDLFTRWVEWANRAGWPASQRPTIFISDEDVDTTIAYTRWAKELLGNTVRGPLERKDFVLVSPESQETMVRPEVEKATGAIPQSRNFPDRYELRRKIGRKLREKGYEDISAEKVQRLGFYAGWEKYRLLVTSRLVVSDVVDQASEGEWNEFVRKVEELGEGTLRGAILGSLTEPSDHAREGERELIGRNHPKFIIIGNERDLEKLDIL